MRSKFKVTPKSPKGDFQLTDYHIVYLYKQFKINGFKYEIKLTKI